MGVYQHPTMRELTAASLHEIVEQRRNQRLITAIEVDSARKKKLTKISDRDMEKYIALGNRCATRLAKIAEALKLCEQDVRSMRNLDSQLGLLEQELGVPELEDDFSV